jgi:hypothetical protein
MLAPRLAIDLSGDVARMLVGNAGGPMRYAVAALPADSMRNGSVEDSGAVAKVLRQLLATATITETRAMIAASDSLASSRVLSFAKDTTEPKIDAAIRAQLPEDGPRMGIRRQELTPNGTERRVYAVAFDRSKVQGLAATVRLAGLEPAVVDLKSLCVARVAALPACMVLDLTANPADVYLIDDSVPRLWHSFQADLESRGDLPNRLAAGIRTVLNYYVRQTSGAAFDPEAPILIAGESSLPAGCAEEVGRMVGRPIKNFPTPPRVPPEIPHEAYLACLGLIMRRR